MKAHELARRLLAGEDLEVRVFNEETAQPDPLGNVEVEDYSEDARCECNHMWNRHRIRIDLDIPTTTTGGSCVDCDCNGYKIRVIRIVVLS